MPIQRYTHYDHSGNDDTHAEEDPDGGWCSTTDVAALEAEVEALKAKLEGLLFAVARNFPGESRYDTALRYIREREMVKDFVGECKSAWAKRENPNG